MLREPRLLQDLRELRIGDSMLNWIASFFETRTTILKLVDYTTKRFDISVGIPQGSPLSPVPYLFYNADLIDLCTSPILLSTAFGYIDDIAILVWGDTEDEIITLLNILHDKWLFWSSTHASVFAVTEYQLIHFSSFSMHNSIVQGAGPRLILSEHTILALEAEKYLSVMIDEQLN